MFLERKNKKPRADAGLLSEAEYEGVRGRTGVGGASQGLQCTVSISYF